MKKLLIVFLTLIAFNVYGQETAVFGAVNDERRCCVDRQIAGGYYRIGDTVGAEFFITASTTLGVDVNLDLPGDVRVGIGTYQETYKSQIEIKGIHIKALDTSWGEFAYVQFGKDVFVRFSVARADYHLDGYVYPSPTEPVYGSENRRVYSNWLWIGTRF